MRSVKEECLSKVILFGERSLRRAPTTRSSISMQSGGRATSCCFLGLRTAIPKAQCGAASDWAGSCAIIIERRRDGALVGSVFWPYGRSNATSGVRLSRTKMQPRLSHSRTVHCARYRRKGAELASGIIGEVK